MKKKLLSVVLAMLITVLVIPFSAYAADTTEEFCEIKKVSATPVYYQLFDEVELYAEYYADPNEDVQLVWTLDGKSRFVDGDEKQMTTGSTATVKFLGNSTVKLQLVAADGEVLAEDELYVEDGKTRGVDAFFANIFASIYLGIFFIFNMIISAFSIFS